MSPRRLSTPRAVFSQCSVELVSTVDPAAGTRAANRRSRLDLRIHFDPRA
jgi:hypothetical protein